MPRYLWLLLLAGGIACESPLSPVEHSQLEDAEERWASRGFPDYSIESRSSCFCPTEATQWARVEVVGGEVRQVTLLATGEVITDERIAWWQTVEEVFASLRGANDQDDLDDVTVEFDSTLGFPTLVNWIPEDGIQDAGGSHSFRNALPLP